jgi:hypothetical protein
MQYKRSAKYIYVSMRTWSRSDHKVNKAKAYKPKEEEEKKPPMNPVLEVNPP